MKPARECLILLILISLNAPSAAASPQIKDLIEVGKFTTQDPKSAEFFADYLFIADGNSLLVYNASNLENPRQVLRFTEFGEPGRVYGLSISGNILYVATGSGWVYVFDISNPEIPKKLYQLSYLNFANDVAVEGRYMYAADANVGMLIFDLSDARNPVLVGSFYVLKANVSGLFQGYGGKSIAVSGKYAFLNGASRKGLYIIDVSDPSKPKEVYHLEGKEIHDIAVSGDDVYLARADGTPQFELLDVSNPYSPRVADTLYIAEIADKSAIAVHPSGYIYAASGNTWHIFRTQDKIPPVIVIEKPAHGETFASPVINITGTASDASGIKEVLVNGRFAGGERWSQTITLSEGINSINITAADKQGNSIAKSIQVTYSPAPVITTPLPQPASPTPTVKAGESMLFLAFAILIFLVRYKKLL